MATAFLSFLEAVRRGVGTVDAAYAGWLVVHDDHERAILDETGAERVRLAGWVRDELSDRIAALTSVTATPKSRDRLSELARYYLRPIAPKHPAASRATLSNWRADAVEVLADPLRRPHPTALCFRPTAVPAKGERLSLTLLGRDPACKWLLRLEDQARDIALYQALRDAADDAHAKADAKAVVGVALIAARLAPGTNPEPTYDYDGVTPLRGLDGRKHSRTRLALPLVLMCAQRIARNAHYAGQRISAGPTLITGYRPMNAAAGHVLEHSGASRLAQRDSFDPDLLAQGITRAWQSISSAGAEPMLAALVRHAALGSDKLDVQQRQDLALLNMAVARRHTDRRGLDTAALDPLLCNDSAASLLFQLRFRRERLLLASHHNPGHDWRSELRGMADLLTVRRRLLSAPDARHLQKVQLHLQQGVHFRLARELTASGKPLHASPPALSDDVIEQVLASMDRIIESLQASFRIADEDHDEITLVNAHRRKTEAEGIVHLLSRTRHSEALAGARRLRRNLNALDDIYYEEHTGLRPDVMALWLLAMADQAVRRNEVEQARHYVTTARDTLPDGIPHLAIRAADIAAAIGETAMASQLLTRIPQRHAWPSYLRHLTARLRSLEVTSGLSPEKQ